jgi:hypothetical protein
MNKVFLSAFALSLSFFPGMGLTQSLEVDDFLEMETIPVLEGDQRFSPTDLHQSEWQVKPHPDQKPPLPGQPHSMLRWQDGPERLLDLKQWVAESAIKERNPDWRRQTQILQHKELVGKVLACQGICELFRGTIPVEITHLSQVKEGDEIHTGIDSSIWIYLMDGSLLRLGPRTSLALKEIILSDKSVFILARLNEGHAYWHPRSREAIKTDYRPETDVGALPLLVRDANPAYIERVLYQQRNPYRMLSMDTIDVQERAIRAQSQKINDLKKDNNKIELVSRMMMVAPNVTAIANGASFHLVHLMGGASYLKRMETGTDGKMLLQLRGYQEQVTHRLQRKTWFSVEPKGREFSSVEDPPGSLQVLELLTQRIPTLELAQELWFKQFSLPVLVSQRPVGEIWHAGYRWWNEEELNQRIMFINEYTRRTETTHLRSVDNLLTRLKRPAAELSPELYQHAVNVYLQGLKKRYTAQSNQVREMNDLQYYIWILRNGKQWNQTYTRQYLAPSQGTARLPWDSF